MSIRFLAQSPNIAYPLHGSRPHYSKGGRRYQNMHPWNDGGSTHENPQACKKSRSENVSHSKIWRENMGGTPPNMIVRQEQLIPPLSERWIGESWPWERRNHQKSRKGDVPNNWIAVELPVGRKFHERNLTSPQDPVDDPSSKAD